MFLRLQVKSEREFIIIKIKYCITKKLGVGAVASIFYPCTLVAQLRHGQNWQ
jgi:hypothetical protein